VHWCSTSQYIERCRRSTAVCTQLQKRREKNAMAHSCSCSCHSCSLNFLRSTLVRYKWHFRLDVQTWYSVLLRTSTNTSTTRRLNILLVLQADGAEGLNSILDLTVNLYLFLEPVHLNLSGKVQDQHFRCSMDDRNLLSNGQVPMSKNLLFHPAAQPHFDRQQPHPRDRGIYGKQAEARLSSLDMNP
jgi:hypothetical protein